MTVLSEEYHKDIIYTELSSIPQLGQNLPLSCNSWPQEQQNIFVQNWNNTLQARHWVLGSFIPCNMK